MAAATAREAPELATARRPSTKHSTTRVEGAGAQELLLGEVAALPAEPAPREAAAISSDTQASTAAEKA